MRSGWRLGAGDGPVARAAKALTAQSSLAPITLRIQLLSEKGKQTSYVPNCVSAVVTSTLAISLWGESQSSIRAGGQQLVGRKSQISNRRNNYSVWSKGFQGSHYICLLQFIHSLLITHNKKLVQKFLIGTNFFWKGTIFLLK